MTKKDYIFISNIIRSSISDVINKYGEEEAKQRCEPILNLANKFILTLKNDNPKFDAVRFKIGCGIEKFLGFYLLCGCMKGWPHNSQCFLLKGL